MRTLTHQTKNLLYRDLYDLIPIYFAPALPIRTKSRLAAPPIRENCRHTRRITTTPRNRSSLAVDLGPDVHHDHSPLQTRAKLPLACPGCGAATQTLYELEAGYFGLDRRSVKNFISPRRRTEQDVVEHTLKNVPEHLRGKLGIDILKDLNETEKKEDQTPFCDRCHNLLHYNTGESISHPSLQALEDTISQSPHKHNHIYHVLDAADFPMSLVAGIYRHPTFAHLRTKNRRSKSQHWDKGKTWDMSFIITRSDILAPRKEQVDRMMPKIVEILRDALGKTGENIRLGNVRCVSAKRGWWTKDIKEKVATDKGGNWLVGKVNVGKSSLFEVIFPKNTEDLDVKKLHRERDIAPSRPRKGTVEAFRSSPMDTDEQDTKDEFTDVYSDISSLLPPAQPEMKFPIMPLVSDLPGTTASPIRVPFSGGKGELIDLPGLERSTIDECVKPENRLDLVMKQRIVPKRIVMKPGSSLLLGGGLIRITPTTPDLVFLAHAFVPIETHLTSTTKAEAIQNGQRESGIRSIFDAASKSIVSSAGIFDLNCDVTKAHAGPLTRRDAVGLKTERLPFIVYSTDILIEGVGWVELVAQVRKKRDHRSEDTSLPYEQDALSNLEKHKSPFPRVEVFSPKGAYTAQRQTLGAWLVGGPDGKPSHRKAKGRPRASMKNARNRRPKGTMTS
ncbi:Genetic interactor of prohibitins 3 [Venturia nashicola]|nr:Genetic interactor of prohibitins 3 [Venturia nashicola]